MTHTPGPWEVSTSDGNPQTKDGFMICEMKYIGDGKDDENARLIAAAPELLDALKLIMGKAAAGKLSNELGKHVKLENIIADCQAAIAKAEGTNE